MHLRHYITNQPIKLSTKYLSLKKISGKKKCCLHTCYKLQKLSSNLLDPNNTSLPSGNGSACWSVVTSPLAMAWRSLRVSRRSSYICNLMRCVTVKLVKIGVASLLWVALHGRRGCFSPYTTITWHKHSQHRTNKLITLNTPIKKIDIKLPGNLIKSTWNSKETRMTLHPSICLDRSHGSGLLYVCK